MSTDLVARVVVHMKSIFGRSARLVKQTLTFEQFSFFLVFTIKWNCSEYTVYRVEVI